MAQISESVVDVADAQLTLIRAGSGKPLLILHDELGYTGWMRWNEALSKNHELVIPLQPGFGASPRQDWIMSYRDLGGFYQRVIRELNLGKVNVIGFSAGAYIAAEMAAANPDIFNKMVLVAPLGLKPLQGEIMDMFAFTIKTHLIHTVWNTEAPEFAEIYGGGMSPEQFELFEDARSESTRLGWEPYMYNPSLGHLLKGIGQLPTQLVWGVKDDFSPRGCIDAYKQAIPGAQIAEIAEAGHRPEIENADAFIAAVKGFLDT
ncbi:MAG: alpha/beta hydrolase [Pseudomonadales bacterium]|nr:alpha/beta hydrolase [Pseudomonadales bacterium]